MRTKETKNTLILMPTILHIVHVCMYEYRIACIENIILYGVLTVLTKINFQLKYVVYYTYKFTHLQPVFFSYRHTHTK